MKRRFLPVREGVSAVQAVMLPEWGFPPCTGGCIENVEEILTVLKVSSLYGRVYPCHVACDVKNP